MKHKKYSEYTALATGVLSLLMSIITFVGKILENQYVFLLLLIGLFFIAQIVGKRVVSAQKESFGILTTKYSARTIKWIKAVQIGSFLIWFYPAILIFNSFKSASSACTTTRNIGLLVTNFTNSADDDFSYKLFQLLEDRFLNSDTISTRKTSKFISPSGNYLDSLKLQLKANCFDRGMVVFGKRSEQSKMFDCNIFIQNLNTISTRHNAAKAVDILFLQNPDVVNFSIDDQSEKVSEFIQGLLFYNGGDLEYAQSLFNKASQIDGDKANKFKSQCLFYIGNSLIKQDKIDEAVNTYKYGISLDAANAYLHYNLASVLLFKKDSLEAFKEFSLAERINSSINNPIKDLVIEERQIPGSTSHFSDLNEKVKTETSLLTSTQQNIQDYSKEFFIRKDTISNKCGLFNRRNKQILKIEFDYIGDIWGYRNYQFFIVGIANKYGAYDTKGRKVIPINYDLPGDVEDVLKASIDRDPKSLVPIID